MIDDPEIQIVDICSPNNTHHELALAALAAGKVVACEKPLAMSGGEAREMAAAASRSGKTNTVWFNYRRVPAIALARQLIDEAASGGSFTSALCICRIGLWIPRCRCCGAWTRTWPVQARPERERPEGGTAKVEIEDASVFVARYDDGALGHFEATRFASGRKNGNTFEVNGENGSLYFDLEDMSRLWYFDSREPKHVQGWRKISVWEEEHPYMKHWWVPGCAIGYEHTFGNQAADLIRAVAEQRPMQPDFADGLRCQLVLDAVMKACGSDRWVDVEQEDAEQDDTGKAEGSGSKKQ